MLAVWSILIVVLYASGAAQGVDASRVIFAFSRDNALPGSEWWKKVHPYTNTPVNAVWLVMALCAVLAVLGFSTSALNSLAGYVDALSTVLCAHIQQGIHHCALRVICDPDRSQTYDGA